MTQKEFKRLLEEVPYTKHHEMHYNKMASVFLLVDMEDAPDWLIDLCGTGRNDQDAYVEDRWENIKISVSHRFEKIFNLGWTGFSEEG